MVPASSRFALTAGAIGVLRGRLGLQLHSKCTYEVPPARRISVWLTSRFGLEDRSWMDAGMCGKLGQTGPDPQAYLRRL